MPPGYIVILLMVPVFSQGCCVGNFQKKRTGLEQDIMQRYYRAVEGEIFMMPCFKCVNRIMEVVWSRTGEGREDGNEQSPFVCGRNVLAEAKHSGKYTSLTCGSNLSFHLQVVERSSLKCFQPEENSKSLFLGQGGAITCPGLNCSDNTDVRWYKGNKTVCEKRDCCVENGWLRLCRVRRQDTGVFFCDRQVNEQGVKWTFRRSVDVRAVPPTATFSQRDPPEIRHPDGSRTEKVELGQNHTLQCEIYFPFEMKFLPKVLWYVNYGGNTKNTTLLDLEKPECEEVEPQGFKVKQRAIIKEVRLQDLDNTYTCIASNTVGNSSVTIKLEKKIKVKLPLLVGYPIVALLLVAGLGIVLHGKWLELQLIYRSRFQHGKHDRDVKVYDVFLSYVWSPTSAVVEGPLTPSSPSRPENDAEACSSSMDPLNCEESEATQRPLEVLLPKVLEDQWGYRLCLLERDMLPGGAYTNDVVLAVQRSQMLICLLSADYLSNSNAVFELESGVQALLQNSSLKLLLIWTSRASASLVQPEPPLPILVQRALKVLPSLDWTSGKPGRATSDFWKTLRKRLPDRRVQLVH
ncbi:interleukin-18 receptor accessory protein-like isoform X2 [Sparus aurata]|uniref:Interleukin-18 receptor accessory protein-like n=1 Tax=Sparus aurata TaxID=8175 RepID=A0A671WSE0_SPAAU|nr:interleukin-18 receptor accessory protein-like isoform X2 [Sparus aurata]